MLVFLHKRQLLYDLYGVAAGLASGEGIIEYSFHSSR